MRILAILLMACSSIAFAEEYTCTYEWIGESDSHPILIEVEKNEALIRGGVLDEKYDVLENTKDELIIIRKFNRENSGKDYPIGVTVIIFDKVNGHLVRANAFVEPSFNKHAMGKCSIIKR